jgi:hypothetical protein
VAGGAFFTLRPQVLQFFHSLFHFDLHLRMLLQKGRGKPGYCRKAVPVGKSAVLPAATAAAATAAVAVAGGFLFTGAQTFQFLDGLLGFYSHLRSLQFMGDFV